jgi:hypothetical protein
MATFSKSAKIAMLEGTAEFGMGTLRPTKWIWQPGQRPRSFFFLGSISLDSRANSPILTP